MRGSIALRVIPAEAIERDHDDIVLLLLSFGLRTVIGSDHGSNELLGMGEACGWNEKERGERGAAKGGEHQDMRPFLKSLQGRDL
ncbi:hypothetical protein GCM10011586_11490 [Silvibacterium dinghuense]|nr:hypothetical protein GCM10011586_11490 [Silvibacterium dinghuense]